MVAPTSFWRLGGGACRWSAVALAFVSVVCHDRGDRSDLQVSFLAFSCLFHYFGPCLNMRYTRTSQANDDEKNQEVALVGFVLAPVTCRSVQVNKQALHFCLKLFFLSSACLILHLSFICSSATRESLWYFELITYLRPHFCANDVYMAVGCIRMQLICLLSVCSPC